MSFKSLIAGSAATVALAVALAGLATPAHATGAPTTLDGAQTDNFKACWNAAGSPPEYRSYVSLKSITVGGVVYRHAMALPAGANIDYRPAAEGISLLGSDNSSAWLTAASPSTNLVFNLIRFDRGGNFGARIDMKDRAALKASSITETFTVARTKGGTVLGTASTTYQYDTVAAAAPQGNCDTTPYSREYNGPAGRWYVGGTATYFDWDTNKAYPPKAATPTTTTIPPTTTTTIRTTTTTIPAATGPDTTAPVLQSTSMPVATTTRTITIGLTATDNVKVTEMRFANEDGTWGAWQPFASSKQWSLSTSTSASKGVYAQVRDAARRDSNVIYKKITCNKPCS